MRYYQIFEKTALTIVLAIILILASIFFALVLSSLTDLTLSVLDYYGTRRGDQIACLEFGKAIGREVYWKDETFLGFGLSDSYGCFMTKGDLR